MVDTHFKSKQNQFLHLDTKKILSAPLYILLAIIGKHDIIRGMEDPIYLNGIHCKAENCMQPAGTWSHGLMSHCVNVSWCHPVIVFANPEALVLADTNL